VPENDPDPYSFPSGHAAVSFALATSTSLSYPEWYVVVPAYAWATATSLARVWHGVHYPLDTMAGAAFGAGAAVLVHLLLPEVDGEDDELGTLRAAPPALTLRLVF
jgi:membrane-associated phospholipid phosphatase